MQQIQQDDLYYSNFVNSIKTKATKQDYTARLKYFMDFIGASKYSDLICEQKTIENNLKSYLVYLRQERGVSYHSANHYLNPVKKFYYVNLDYEFKWSLIKMYLGDDDDGNNSIVQEGEEDRSYTRLEIQTMLKTANDIRSKIIILLISSSGMRSGAIPLLKIRNLTKIEQKDYYLYQINVYEKSKRSNYKTFCTPECAVMVDTYLNYRKHAGELLKPESPLIREQFNPSDSFKVNNPKTIGKGLIKYLVNEVLTKYSALRSKIEYDYENKRKVGKNSTMLTHALRKYFDTTCRKAGVYPDFVELLMGHRLPGIRHHYFKPELNDLFYGTAECRGYITAINDLTINDEHRLKIENQELKGKLDDEFASFGQELSELKQMLSSNNNKT